MEEILIDKNSNRIFKINNLYNKLLSCSYEDSPEYYLALRKSLILEKITGILTAKCSIESPDGRYFLFDYDDFKILHSLLAGNKEIQNGIEYIYGISLAYDEHNEKDMITRLIIKTAEEEYLYMSCSQKRDVTIEVITKPNYDDLSTKLSPKPDKIFNILEFLSESIDYDLLKKEKTASHSDIYNLYDFIKDTNVPICEEIPTYIMSAPRPSIKCKDGFTISVQASSCNACSPRISGLNIYKSFEVISMNEINEFENYISNYKYISKLNKTNSLFEYDLVPFTNLENLIEAHGGIDKQKTFANKSNASELKKLSYIKNIMANNQK